MTIRLLCAHSIYPVNAIVTLDAGTEAGLVATKQASTNLTGGVVYTPPLVPNQTRLAEIVFDGAGNVLGLAGPGGSIISLGGGSTTTAPGQPAKPVLTALANAISVAWTAPATGGSAILATEFTADNGVTTPLTTNPQTIAAAAGVPITGTVRSRNGIGYGPASPQADAVTPTAAVATPSAPVTTAITDAGANMMKVTTAAPASNGSAVTAMNLRAYDATTGEEDIDVFDLNAGSTALTHTVLGCVAGKSYVFKWTATNANGTSGQGAVGVSRALPVLTTPNAKKGTLKWGIIGLLSLTPAVANAVTYSLTGVFKPDWTRVRIHVCSASTTAQTVKVAFSPVPVLGTYPALLGGFAGASGMPGLNNAGNWTDATVVIPAATGANAAANLDGPAIGSSEWMTNPNVARTDGGVHNAWTARVEWPAGADVTTNDIMPNNVASPQDYGLGKETNLGGIVHRPYSQAVAAVTTKTAFTQNAVSARATGSAAFFLEFELANGVTGIDLVMADDSRGCGGVQATNAPINHYLNAFAAACTKAEPAGFFNISEAGAGPARWINRTNAFSPYCGGSRVFTQTQSINYYGGGPKIAGYTGNKTLCDQNIALWEAAGCQVIRSTTMGVDTTKSYKWEDDSIRHDGNAAEEALGTGSRPTIAMGRMNEGPMSTDGRNSYTQFTPDGLTAWLEPADTTGAHMNELWGIRRAKYYVPYMK